MSKDCPYKDQEEYDNASCRILKALLSRYTVIRIQEQRLWSLKQHFCGKNTHALKPIRKNTTHFICDICSLRVT